MCVMKMINSYNIIYILSFFILGFSSCMEEETVKETPGDGKTLCLSISASSPVAITPTKSEQSMANDIKDLCVLIYDKTTGEIQEESQYYDEVSDVVNTLNGATAKKEIMLQITPGLKVVRLLSGCGDVRKEDGYSTLEKLKARTFGIVEKNGVSLPQTISYGEGDKDFDVSSTTSAVVTANLKRIYSMITVVIDNRVSGAVISPKSVKLCHVPAKGSLVENKIPGSPSSADYVETAEEITYATNWSHESTTTPAFFMYENMQGNNETPNTDQTKKTPPALGGLVSSADVVKKDKTCSYIEVSTDYKASSSLNPGEANTGTVVYRFFLGADILENFDVARNTHYKVTLTLSGDGGIKEGTWRVETDIMSDFTIDDVYIGFRKGSKSVGTLKFGDNDEFFKNCTWTIEDVTPASGTMLGNAKADKGEFVEKPSVDNSTKTISFTSAETNVYERWPRYKTYKITASKSGKSVSKTIHLYQVTRILEPIGYFKRADNTTTENIEVKEFDLSSGGYKIINSAGAWTAEVVSENSNWVVLGKFDGDDNVSVDGQRVIGTGGNVRFTYEPSGTASNVRYACIRVKYHNNQCEHEIYLRQGKNDDIQLIKDGTSWAYGNLVEKTEGYSTYEIATYATQPGPLFQGGSNKGVSSISPGYNGGKPSGWSANVQSNWGKAASTSQGPCPNGYTLPSVRDFTVLRQKAYDGALTAVVGYLHDDDPTPGWSWDWKSSVNVTSQNHSNPAKGTLFVNENNGYVNLFFPFGNGVLEHSKIGSGHEQEYDNGLNEIGVGWRTSDGKLHFEEDYKPEGASKETIYEGYGATYWSGTKTQDTGTSKDSYSLYMKLWYFLNRDVPVYVSDGSSRWGDSRGVNKRQAIGVTRQEAMFVRCVKNSLQVDDNYWNNK